MQTKLYTVGNDPNGIHAYINTTLFLYSVTGSAISVLKTVVLMIIERHQFQCSLVSYLTKLVVFERLNAQGTAVNGQQASSAMGKTLRHPAALCCCLSHQYDLQPCRAHSQCRHVYCTVDVVHELAFIVYLTIRMS